MPISSNKILRNEELINIYSKNEKSPRLGLRLRINYEKTLYLRIKRKIWSNYYHKTADLREYTHRQIIVGYFIYCRDKCCCPQISNFLSPIISISNLVICGNHGLL